MPKKIDFGLLEKVGKPKDLVDNMLNAQIESVEAALGGKGIGNKILSMFVQNGNRVQLDAATVAERIGGRADEETVCDILDHLVESGLLRHAGENRYEIINNLMAQRAFQKTEGENLLLRKLESMVRNRIERDILLVEDDLNYIDPFLERLDLTEQERKYVEDSRRNVKKKKRRLAIAVTTAFILLSTLATVTFFSSQEAQRSNRLYQNVNKDLKETNDQLIQNQNDLKEAQKIIEQQRDSALIREATAQQLRVDAQSAQRQEFEARIRAQTAAERERIAAIRAEEQALKAERAERLAKLAAEEAEKGQKEAELARQLATRARARAEALNKVVISHNAANRSLSEEDAKLRALIALHTYQINYELPEYGDVFHPSIVKALYTAALEVDQDLQYGLTDAHRGNIRDIVVHPTEDIFYTTGSDGSVKEWVIDEWNRIGKPDQSNINRVNFAVEGGAVNNYLALSPDAQQLLVLGELPVIQVISTSAGQQMNTIPVNFRSEIFGGGFLNSKGDFIAFSQDSAFIYQNPANTLAPFPKISSKINSIFFDDGVYALSYKGIPLINGYSLEIQKFHNGTFVEDELFFLEEYYRELSAAATAKVDSSSYLALGFEDGTILMFEWDAANLDIVEDGNRFIFKEHQASISDIEFSNSGNFLAVASLDGTVSVWQVSRLNDPSYLPMVFDIHDGWAMSLAFSNDDRFLLVGDQNGGLNFWSLRPSDYVYRICETLRDNYRNPLDRRIDEVEWERLFGSEMNQSDLCR